MPNRYIRDGVLTSERYLSVDVPDRLLFFELILCADDFGVVQLSRGTFRRCSSTDGKSPEALAAMITHLVDQDLVRVYQVTGGRYAWIPRNDFRPRAIHPKNPLPHDSDGAAFNELKELARKRQTYARTCPSNDGHSPPTSTSTSTLTPRALRAPPVGNSVGKSKPRPGWWRSERGIDKAGRTLGLSAKPGESYPEFKERIFHLLKERQP